MLLILPASAYGQGICDRTPRVRDKLMEVTGVSNCRNVAAEHLSNLHGALDLYGAGIGNLQARDFRGLSSLYWLRLRQNSLTELPEGIFQGLHALQKLWLQDNSLTNLPEGVFDELLDTLRELRVDPLLKATLCFRLTEQKSVEGATMRIRVWLSRALPVAVRVPYTVGGTARKDDHRSQSPNPAEGLVFLSGERAKTITFRHSKDADGLGKTVVLTLGKPAEIGLRRSDGRGPDAPHLKTGNLLLRSDQRHPEQVHRGNHPGLRSGPPDFRQQPLFGLRGGQRRRGSRPA